MADNILDNVQALEQREATFRKALAPEAEDAALTAVRLKVRSQFSVDGLGDLTPDDVLVRVDRLAREQYDEQRRQEAAALDTDLQATARAIEETIAALSPLLHPHDTIRPAGERQLRSKSSAP